jgi:hypothetical protein
MGDGIKPLFHLRVRVTPPVATPLSAGQVRYHTSLQKEKQKFSTPLRASIKRPSPWRRRGVLGEGQRARVPEVERTPRRNPCPHRTSVRLPPGIYFTGKTVANSLQRFDRKIEPDTFQHGQRGVLPKAPVGQRQFAKVERRAVHVLNAPHVHADAAQSDCWFETRPHTTTFHFRLLPVALCAFRLSTQTRRVPRTRILPVEHVYARSP